MKYESIEDKTLHLLDDREARKQHMANRVVSLSPEELKTHESLFVETDADNVANISPVILNIDEFLSKDIPPRKLLLKPFLPVQGLAMVHAYRGVGKTFFGLSVGYAVASGGEFLAWKAPEPAGVLILDGEMPANAMQERMVSLVRMNDKEPSAPLRIMTPDLQPKNRPAFNLADEDDQLKLEANLDGIALIIVDNISTLCRGGKENEAEGWLPMQAWALRQRAKGRSVLFIHHSGKSGSQRGTSKREDVLDTVISLQHPSDYVEEQGARFNVIFEKSRGFFGDDSAPLEAQLITDDDGSMKWSFRLLADAIYDQIVDLHNEGLSQKEIALEVGRNKSNISRTLKKARENGDIKS